MFQGRVGRTGLNHVMVSAFSFMYQAKGVLGVGTERERERERERFILLVKSWESSK